MKILITFLLFCSTLFAQESWELMEPVPFSPRHHPVTFSLNGYGFVTTGAISMDSVKYENDMWKYDPIEKTWEELDDFTGPARSFSYGDTWEGKAYMGFGRSEQGDALDDLWEYNPENDEWTELTTCPCEGRFHPAFTIAKGVLYVGLGNNNDGNLKDFWAYDIETDSWEQLPDIPGPPRHHPYHFTVNDTAYAMFGHGNNMEIYNDVYRFDDVAKDWVVLPNFPGEERVAGTQFNYNGKGYVLSGQGSDHENFDDGEFWEYDPSNLEWTQLEPHPGSGRWAPGSFLINNEVYLTSGLSNDSLENNMYRYILPLPASVKELVEINSVHPNPATSYIDLDIEKEEEFKIIDMNGTEVLKGKSNNRIDISYLSSGVYFVIFESKYAKFIKK